MKKILLIASITTLLFTNKNLMAQETEVVFAEDQNPEQKPKLDQEVFKFHELKEIPEMEYGERMQPLHPNPEYIDVIHRGMQEVDVKIFIGTWCDDSKNLLPQIEMLFSMVGFPPDELTLYNLDKQKKSKSGIEKEFKIKFVPTIIFIKDGKELGRIVERPEDTLDKAVFDILKKLYPESDEVETVE